MGKASKWFRALLGLQKTDSSHSSSFSPKHKRRWSFLKPSSTPNHNHTLTSPELTLLPNNHAVAVAAATAAVAEAAVAAAQAAAAVVRLTSSSRSAGSIGIREEWAAVKIQSAFRGCLARKALRALKGLVKLQALVRGHIERKQQAKKRVKIMQAHLQAPARFCAGRAQIMHTPSHSTSKSSTCLLHGPGTPDKFESTIRSKSMKYEQSPVLKRNGSRSCGSRSESVVDEQSWSQGRSFIRTSCKSEEKSDRILEIDYGKSQLASKRRSLFFTRDSTSLQSGQTSSCEVEETPFCTASNSPQYLSASSKEDGSKRSNFTHTTRSDGSRSYLYGYSDYPSYMAYTESSKAKVRSMSAPKQRPQYDRSSSSNRYSLNGFGDTRLATHKVSAFHTGFTNKAYPGSGRLDKLGMPVGYRY
ncbi:unnamed protein product [Lupinus luteus]|uniref:DUF4005 domain-containing protein n=1 Tax=Lupinus luteus TaxID=3873 RepID=A0AAV1YDC0_LUPLU